VSWPRPAPRPRPRPCCARGASPGTCAFGAAVGAGVVVRRRTCSASAASCAVNVALLFVSVWIISLCITAAFAKLMMPSTVSCWNHGVAVFATVHLAPMAVFFC
jgi:hypothetical protein